MDIYIRGNILHLRDDPGTSSPASSYEIIEDGYLALEAGHIVQKGAWANLTPDVSVEVAHYPTGLIVPGFIDTHVHLPQIDVIASYGEQLLEWLETYVFPAEAKLSDKAYASDVAKRFINELIKNGTTTASVFTTTHPNAVEALFEQAETVNMRLVAGMVLADQNYPVAQRQTPEGAYTRSKALIEKWHHKPGSRFSYALEPRFAPAVSTTLLKVISRLKQEYPDVYVHTHISENKAEIQWVKTLFGVDNYLAVYDEFGLLGKKTLLAHGVHLTETEIARISETKSNLAFCPTSNLFLGSGLFNYRNMQCHHIPVGFGTDVGAGTSFSLLQTYSEAYKVMQLQQEKLSALEGLYLATLGGARALSLDDNVGNFEVGKEADIVVLDMKGSTALLQHRLQHSDNLLDKLFVLMMLGDERSILATYINGQCVSENGLNIEHTC